VKIKFTLIENGRFTVVACTMRHSKNNTHKLSENAGFHKQGVISMRFYEIFYIQQTCS